MSNRCCGLVLLLINVTVMVCRFRCWNSELRLLAWRFDAISYAREWHPWSKNKTRDLLLCWFTFMGFVYWLDHCRKHDYLIETFLVNHCSITDAITLNLNHNVREISVYKMKQTFGGARRDFVRNRLGHCWFLVCDNLWQYFLKFVVCIENSKTTVLKRVNYNIVDVLHTIWMFGGLLKRYKNSWPFSEAKNYRLKIIPACWS